ncbi:MAG: bestrophin [Hyphomicrobiales bacterium]|nr:bestrophin [Hyphomicrobiales bacterium]
MIVRERPHFFALFFILRGSVIPRIFPQVLVVFALSTLIVWAHRNLPGYVPGFSGGPFALLGIALSIFLGFRNNVCFERWWEARKDWGQLITSSRDLARQTLILSGRRDDDAAEKRSRLLNLAIAFAQALVGQLRPGADLAKARGRLPAEVLVPFEASRNRCDFILRQMGGIVAEMRASGTITDVQFSVLDATLGRMSAVLAACERIRNTPVPFGYTLLVHRTAHIFCFLLPFGFADVLGWGTPFMTALVAYTFFGLDALGDELEDPFGNLPNGLPINALADTIEINLREALGESPLPSLPLARDHILM